MVRTTPTPSPHTYLSDGEHSAEIAEFARVLDQMEGGAGFRPALVAADGSRTELPDDVFDVLKRVAEAMSQGMGVSIAPLSARLTTQQAADYLGISRPTLVRILERGEIPMEKPGRHRFVRLSDLIAYQDEQRQTRRRVLDRMQEEGHDDGLYEATDGPPPRTR